MRLRAIRVQDVGHFAAPVALEGLTGELDVLAASNEAGKSTLFRALEAVFYERYTGLNTRLQALHPYGGGSPLIETDFTAQGELWRLTKQFGRGKFASLQGLGGARRSWRGDEAEDALARLVGLEQGSGRAGVLPGRFGLLWVGQGGAFEPQAPDAKRGEVPVLRAIIEREVSAVAGGSLARSVRGEADRVLSGLATQSRLEPKAGGAWAAARSRASQVRSELDIALIAQQTAAQRRAQLADLRESRAALVAPEAVARHLTDLAAAVAASEAATASRRLLKDAGLRVAAAEAGFKEASQHLTGLQRAADDAVRLTGVLAQAEPAAAAAAGEVAHIQARLAAIQARGDEMGSRLRALDAAGAIAAAQDRLASLEATLAAATELDGVIAGLQEQVAGNPVTRSELDRLVTVEAALTRASDALAAEAPQVRIAYLPGGEGRVLLQGQPVPEGAVMAPDAGPLILEIAGVGRIEIAAAASAGRERQLAAREAALQQQAASLSALGVRDVEEARERHSAREALMLELSEARARLQGVAPKGLAPVHAAIKAQRAVIEAGAVDGVSVPAGSDPAAEAAAVKAELEQLRAAYKNENGLLETAVQAATRARETVVATSERLAGVEEMLPPSSDRAQALAGAAEAAARLRSAYDDAVREMAAVRSAVPDAEHEAALAARVKALQDEKARAAEQLRVIDLDVARLQGEDAMASEQGLAGRVPELQGLLERAEADAARLDTEVAALSLLRNSLDAAEARNLDRFLAPVVRALEPFLDLAFPGARVHFNSDFSVAELERLGAREGLKGMSGGTREQLAILVRLAFAQLLADGGHEAPLILDDPLVYSDDERVQRIFAALRQASQRHQVLVLTCHKAAFAPLGGREAELTSWARAA